MNTSNLIRKTENFVGVKFFVYFSVTLFFVKVSRPSFIPFWGKTIIEKHVPLSLVIDVIIEQGTDAYETVRQQ